MCNPGIRDEPKQNSKIKDKSQNKTSFSCFMPDTRCAFQYIKVVLMFQFVNGKIAVQFYDDTYFICNEKLGNVSFTMI